MADFKHAVVVGIGPGLGRSLALNYARHGYDLTLVARRPESLDPVAAEVAALGRRAWPIPADAADPEAIEEVVTQASERGPISLLHHNASMHVGGLLDADPETISQAIMVSAVSAVVAVQAALNDLQATRGLVAWTGGGIALAPHAEYGVLAMGKAALRAAGLAMAQELEPRGVRLRMMTINGFIHTGGRFDPDRIAGLFWDYANKRHAPAEQVYAGR